ncbi:MAG: pimeloyl-[acyl-carrier protein] methyl ester esterase [Fibrobacteres bacterium]|nr:pimeloyl-[acyl-carrier protein] methyl ester esterase [Fibrobacterota bacterium]
MGDPVVWLGGWASGLACWRGTLEALYPRREHTFLDSHAVLEEPGLLALAAKGLPKKGTLVAWSMGSLILHKALAEGTLAPECRLVSASPIFDFCREGGPWPKAALMRMARRLPRERETVLAEFWSLSKGTSPVTQGQESAWVAQSRNYALPALLQGLEFLGNTVIDRAALPANARHLFLASPQDPLAPTPRGVFPGREWVAYARGHLPFLDHPDLLTPWLDGARPAATGVP